MSLGENMATIETRLTDTGEKTYRVRLRLKGYPTKSASFTKLSEAKKWAITTEASLREGRIQKTTISNKHTLKEMLAKYNQEILPQYSPKEQQERKRILEWWSAKLGYLLLSDINHIIINDEKRNLNFAPARINKYLKNLSHAFSIAINEWGWLNDNPMSKVKSPKLPRGRVRYLNDDERSKIISACKKSKNPMLYPAFILSLSTGMRQGEVMNLYWTMPKKPPNYGAWGVIDINQNNIILHQTKNGDYRRIPLTGLAYELIKIEYDKRNTENNLLFPSPTKPEQHISLRKAWLNAIKEAKLEDFRWHDIRHTSASYLAMNGASLIDIASILGHKSLAMTHRYSHLSNQHLNNIIENMNKKILGQIDYIKQHP